MLKLLRQFPPQFRLMFWGMLLSTTGASMTWPFLMIYVKARTQLPLTQVASLLTLNAAAGLLAAFIAGPIIDRVGRKWVMVISLAGNGLAYLQLSQAGSFTAFAVLLALSGCFAPLYRVGGDAMLADLIPPERRPDAYALLRLSNNLGVALGPTIGGLLTTLSYAVAFIGAAVGMTGYGLLLAFFARETLPGRAASQDPPDAARPLQPPKAEPLGGYAKVLGDRAFLSFTTTFALVQVCAVLMWVLMPVYAKDSFAVPESRYGLIPTTNALMVVFLQVWVTQRARRFPALRVMTVGALFYALGVGSVAWSGGFWGFWLSMVVMTFGELLLMPTSSTYVAGLAPPDMRGRYMSLYGLTWGVASGIAPLAGGYLSDTLGPAAIWYAGLAAGLLAVAGFMWLARVKMPSTGEG
jgi:MFS family permease